MRPAGIAPDATDASAGFPMFDPRLLRRVPYLPGPLIGQLVSHEGDAVLEGNPRLLEATCNDHRLAPRNRQGSVKRGARDSG